MHKIINDKSMKLQYCYSDQFVSDGRSWTVKCLWKRALYWSTYIQLKLLLQRDRYDQHSTVEHAAFIQMLQRVHQRQQLHAMPLSWLSQRAIFEIETLGLSLEGSSGQSFEGAENGGSIPASIPLLLDWLMLSRVSIRALAIPVVGDEPALDNPVTVRSVQHDPGSTTTVIGLFFSGPASVCTTGSVFCNNKGKTTTWNTTNNDCSGL